MCYIAPQDHAHRDVAQCQNEAIDVDSKAVEDEPPLSIVELFPSHSYLPFILYIRDNTHIKFGVCVFHLMVPIYEWLHVKKKTTF